MSLFGSNAFDQAQPSVAPSISLPTVPVTIKEEKTGPDATTVALTIVGTLATAAAGAALQYFIFCQALKRCS